MEHSISILYLTVLLTTLIEFGLSTSSKRVLPENDSLPLSGHSHEELHSKNDSNQTQVTTNPVKHVEKVILKEGVDNKVTHKNVNASLAVSVSPQKNRDEVVAEGGLKINTNKTPLSNNSIKSTTPKSISLPLTTTVTNQPILSSVKQETTEKHTIHGRPGVPELVPLQNSSSNTSTLSNTSSPPVHKKKKKPLVTMIKGDKETKESESFIESPTTGRDYVLSIVLIILALPLVGYIIKIIYRRGTEFTERQQYHRMYLIDGMYNSR